MLNPWDSEDPSPIFIWLRADAAKCIFLAR